MKKLAISAELEALAVAEENYRQALRSETRATLRKMRARAAVMTAREEYRAASQELLAQPIKV